MKRPKYRNVVSISLIVVAVMTANLACGGTTEKLQEAAEKTAETMAVEEPTSPPTSEKEPTVTSPPKPTKTATPKAKEAKLVAQGFGQEDRDLGYGFILKNPNSGYAVEGSQYQVAVYDEDGAVVETDSGYINVILPNQKLGYGGTIWLDEGVTVHEIEVQLKQGDVVATDPIPSFTVENISFFDSGYFDGVTAVVTSPYNRDLGELRVSAVAYNDAGEIVGGGFTYLNFILAGSSTGVDVPIYNSGDVSTVELYPTVSGLTFLGREDELPEGAEEITLEKQGFGQSDRDAGYGMLIKNSNNNFSIENSQYHVTAYAEDGRVLTTDEGYVNVLLPEQILGIGGDLYLGEGMVVDHVEIQVKPGTYVESESLPFFTSENVNYQADAYFPKVTGQIVNPYNKDITDLFVSAIAYNQAGEIIGGGFTYLDFVPANGKSAVEVSITSTGEPAKTELFATVSGLSEIE